MKYRLKSSPWLNKSARAVAAVSLSLGASSAYAQYAYVPTAGQSGNWNVAARWSGGPAGTFPNAADAIATINVPSSTAPSGAYNLQLSAAAGQVITVGAVTVNNSSAATGNLRLGANGNGSLIFQANAGPATYVENAGAPDSTFNSVIFAPVTFASNTIITQNHNLSNNDGTQFSSSANSAGGISSPAGVTLTKEGLGNVEFSVAPAAPATGFQGSLVVNSGGIRITDNVFANASSVEVNPGGQFQLGSSTLANWSLSPGATLTLRGPGKSAGAANPDGALRFQNNAASASFNNPVTLAADATIFVNGNAAPTPPNLPTYGNLTLSQAVSGPGTLTKNGVGVLTLTQPNTYGSPASTTIVSAGTLIANNLTGSATGAGGVQIGPGASLGGSGFIAGSVTSLGGNLAPGNSAGTLTLGGLVLDASSLLKYELDAPGAVGGGINDLTIVNGNLTLAGTLEISPLGGFNAGAYRLLDYTGTLSSSPLTITGLPVGFNATIDTSIAGQVNLNVSAVPEPAALTLAALGVASISGLRRRGKQGAV